MAVSIVNTLMLYTCIRKRGEGGEGERWGERERTWESRKNESLGCVKLSNKKYKILLIQKGVNHECRHGCVPFVSLFRKRVHTQLKASGSSAGFSPGAQYPCSGPVKKWSNGAIGSQEPPPSD